MAFSLFVPDANVVPARSGCPSTIAAAAVRVFSGFRTSGTGSPRPIITITTRRGRRDYSTVMLQMLSPAISAIPDTSHSSRALIASPSVIPST